MVASKMYEVNIYMKLHGFNKWHMEGKDLETMSFVNGAWSIEGCVE